MPQPILTATEPHFDVLSAAYLRSTSHHSPDGSVRLSPTLTAGLLTATAMGGLMPAPAGRIGRLHTHILDTVVS
jgi:hypothetical protein